MRGPTPEQVRLCLAERDRALKVGALVRAGVDPVAALERVSFPVESDDDDGR